MTPETLRQAAITLFGERGWMSRLAGHLGVDRSSVSRWFAGLPVPGPVAAAVEAWLLLYEITGAKPDELSSGRRPFRHGARAPRHLPLGAALEGEDEGEKPSSPVLHGGGGPRSGGGGVGRYPARR